MADRERRRQCSQPDWGSGNLNGYDLNDAAFGFKRTGLSAGLLHREVRPSLVGGPVFKTGEGDEKFPWWVRFPCTSAIPIIY